MVFDQHNNFYLIHLSILITFLLVVDRYCREKLHVNHFWELRVK